MKPVLAWVKKNWVAVVAGFLLVVAVPLAWFFSSGWNAKIKDAQEKKANAEFTKVNSTAVEYVIPSYEPGVQPVTLKTEPNIALTAWFKEQRDVLGKQADEVGMRAIHFNKGVGPDAAAVGRSEHTVLIEGIFPGTGDLADEFNSMEDALLSKRGRVNPYNAMLDNVRAGGPMDPVRLTEILTDLSRSESDKITAAIKRSLTDEETERIEQLLRDRRLAEYQRRSADISVYATSEIFGVDGKRSSVMPNQSSFDALAKVPDVERQAQLFVWQWDTWVIADVLAAVQLANTTDSGRPTEVKDSVVKRIERLWVSDPEGVFGRVQRSDGDNAAAPAASAGTPGLAPLDPQVSITGRFMDPSNTVYDIRRVELVVVASSKRIDEFLAAINRTNFMTVTDYDLTSIDTWSELSQGYYYGPEHVVQATIGIETVWLRKWVAPLMPDAVRGTLGVPDEPEPAEAEPGTEGSEATDPPPGQG